MGQQIRAGDVLVELESNSEKLMLAEETARFSSLHPQIEALNAQTGVLDQGHSEERSVLTVAVEEARARYREADATAKQAAADAERARRLHDEQLLAESEYQRAQADAQEQEGGSGERSGWQFPSSTPNCGCGKPNVRLAANKYFRMYPRLKPK